MRDARGTWRWPTFGPITGPRCGISSAKKRTSPPTPPHPEQDVLKRRTGWTFQPVQRLRTRFPHEPTRYPARSPRIRPYAYTHPASARSESSMNPIEYESFAL
ncbi:hypothetical protein GCM10009837_83180 [Streptomyces durmitorensis]